MGNELFCSKDSSLTELDTIYIFSLCINIDKTGILSVFLFMRKSSQHNQ